jgi:alpha-mannosidase
MGPPLSSPKNSTGVELLNGMVSTVVLSDPSGPWGHDVDSYDQEVGRPELLEAEVIEDGPLVKKIRHKFSWGKSTIWMDTVNYSHSENVLLHFRINWQKERQLLKLEIPLNMHDAACVAKMPGEVCQRPANGEEYPCHEWVAVSDKKAALGIANSSCYSYDFKGSVLRMVLAKAVPFAEHPPFGYCQTNNVCFTDHGWQEHRFLLCPLNTDEKFFGRMEREAQEFQIPVEIFQDSCHGGSLDWQESSFSSHQTNIAIHSIRKDQDWSCCLQELEGEKCDAEFTFKGKSFSASFMPWEVKSLKLKD